MPLIQQAKSTPFIDSVSLLKNASDPTKTARFSLSGLTTGANRVYTLADLSGTVPLLETDNTWTGQNTFAIGTITTSQPISITQTWNNAGVVFTGVDINITNTASAATSKLFNARLDGTSLFNVDKTGNITAGLHIITGPSGSFITDNNLYVTSTIVLGNDVFLVRDAANVLAQRNSTTAQTLRIYNTYTDASNYERGIVSWASNVLKIGCEVAGTGTLRNVNIFGSSIQFNGGLASFNAACTQLSMPVGFSIGTGSAASATYGTAIGYYATASGGYSFAGQSSATAAATFSTALGYGANVVASYTAATALGCLASARGANEVAICAGASSGSALQTSLQIQGITADGATYPVGAVTSNWIDGTAVTRRGRLKVETFEVATAQEALRIDSASDQARIGIGGVVVSGQRVTTYAGIATDVILVTKAHASQTADYVQYQTSAGLLKHTFSSDSYKIYTSYTDASNYTYAGIFGSFSDGHPGIGSFGAGTGANFDFYVGATGSSAVSLRFYVATGEKWRMTGSGHFIAASDNSYDIGALGATRPRTGYFGTSVSVPLVTYNSGNLRLNTGGGYDILFQFGEGTTWKIDGSGFTYALLPSVTNTYDIGNSTYTIRTGYFGTSLFSPILYGGTSSGGNLLINATSHATKGVIQLNGTTDSFPALSPIGNNGVLKICLASTTATFAEVQVGSFVAGSGSFAVNSSFNTVLWNAAAFGWSTSGGVTSSSTPNQLALYSPGTGILEQRNSTTAQTFRVYGTYTDASNYSRFSIYYDSGLYYLKGQAAGTGTLTGIAFGDAAAGITYILGTSISLQTNDGDLRWNGFYLYPNATANTKDFGSTTFTWRNGYFGTAVITPTSRYDSAYNYYYLGPTGLRMADSGILSWYTGISVIGATDVALQREAAGTLALRSDTTSQTLRGYGSYTDASNYKRWSAFWSGNDFHLSTQAAGTGSAADVDLFFSQSNDALMVMNRANDAWKSVFCGTIQSYSGVYVYGFGVMSPIIYGSTSSGGTLYLYGSSHATKGDVVINTNTYVSNSGVVTAPAFNNDASFVNFYLGSSGLRLGSASSITWYSTTSIVGTVDLSLQRQGAGILAQRDGTNAQEFRIYNTYTDTSNGEWATVGWSSNVLQIGTNKNGTGSTRAIDFLIGGTASWRISSSGHLLGSTDSTYDIGANGANRPRNVFVSGYVLTGGGLDSNTYLGITNTLSIRSGGADGNILICNYLATSFASLLLGPSGTTYNRIKHGAAGLLQVRLADDSAPSSISFTVLVEANTATSGSPNILTSAETTTLLTNEGTTAENCHTLPTAVAGYIFEFVCQDADGIKITAATGDTIRDVGTVSATAGYIRSSTVGSTLRLVSINATEWIVMSKMGTWTIDS